MCAICLDYFTDPVSIGCGHNFCRVCVTQLWGGEDEEDRDELDREEEEEEVGEEEEVEAVGAGGGWDTPMREEDYEGDMEEEAEEEEERRGTPRDPVNHGQIEVPELLQVQTEGESDSFIRELPCW